MRLAAIVGLLLIVAAPIGTLAPAPGAGASLPVFQSPSVLSAGPILPEGSFEGPAWLAYSMMMENSTLSIALTYTARNPMVFASALYDENNALLLHLELLSTDGGENGLYANQTLASGANVSFQIAPHGTAENVTGYFNLTTKPGDPERVKLLYWFAGGFERLSYATTTSPGATILGHDSGPEAYLLQSKDFGGAANLRAYPAGVGARLQYHTSRMIEVHNTLIGSFAGGISVDAISVTTSTGEVACPCKFLNVTGPSPVFGPGAYSFHLSGVGAGASALADVVLSAADARLP